MSRVDIEVPRPHAASEFLFNWQRDVDRLTRQAQAAMKKRKSDQWVLAEAECTLDLIVAELVAARSRSRADGVSSAVVRLETWHTQLQDLIRKLQSLQT
jgi:hypothetical protein